MRIRNVVWALAAGCLATGVALPGKAADAPYYRFYYPALDTTYERIDAQARRYASFYWDGKYYCRYRSGWNGPGAYEAGTRRRPQHGWDGGYPWQGPGTPADHEDAEDFAAARVAYAREFGHEPVCGPYRHHRRPYRGVVLRRMD